MDDFWLKKEGEDHITHVSLIGVGGYGEVHEMRNEQTKEVYARKLVRPFNGSITKSDILSELCAVEKLCQGHHPNIIRVFEHGRLNPKNSAYYIDMELCDLTLEDYTWGTKFVPSLPNWKTAKETNTTVTLIVPIMRQIADGVAFIHSHDQVHRDLKPSNILYSARSNHWKISDFGLTSSATTTRPKITLHGRGSECYKAPELLCEGPGSFNKKSDIWSIGCILHELCTGESAFRSDFAVFEFKSAGLRWDGVRLSQFDETSDKHFSKLISETFEVDPRNRPTATRLGTEFSNWFWYLDIQQETKPLPVSNTPANAPENATVVEVSSRGSLSRDARAENSLPASTRPSTKTRDIGSVRSHYAAYNVPPINGTVQQGGTVNPRDKMKSPHFPMYPDVPKYP